MTVTRRQRRILQYALSFLKANLDNTPWVLDEDPIDGPPPTEEEIEELGVTVGRLEADDDFDAEDNFG